MAAPKALHFIHSADAFVPKDSIGIAVSSKHLSARHPTSQIKASSQQADVAAASKCAFVSRLMGDAAAG